MADECKKSHDRVGSGTGVFATTWETVQGGTVSEIVFVATDEDYATKNQSFLGYILEQNGDGGSLRWKECSEKYIMDCQAYRFTYDGQLYGTPIRNEEIIKTIGATKWSILKRKMEAVKEGLTMQRPTCKGFCKEIKKNAPIKTSKTVLVAQNSVKPER